MSRQKESHISLIVNGKAGTGTAVERARRIQDSFRNVSDVSIQELMQFTQSEWIAFLNEVHYLCVLGGDGTAFSILSKLYQLGNEIEQLPKVAALGAGGENVLSKAMGTYADDIVVVQQILDQQFQVVPLHPQVVHLDTQQQTEAIEIPSFWSIHAGFSAAVLYEIERMRAAGARDFQRRYFGTIKNLIALRKTDPIYISSSKGYVRELLELGIISGQLPFWTSKVRLAHSGLLPVMMSISKDAAVNRDQSVFYARLLLEMISLKIGLPMQRDILQFRNLEPGERITVADVTHKQVAVDSEVHKSARAETTIQANQASVQVIKR